MRNSNRWVSQNWMLLAAGAVIVFVFWKQIADWFSQAMAWIRSKTTGNSTGASKAATRGIRNNNPGNILLSAANAWEGKVANNTDGKFEQFSSMSYGIRAALRLLQNYIDNGHATIEQIGKRWSGSAPGYVEFLEQRTGIPRGAAFRADDKAALITLARAIFKIETGVEFSNTEVEAGWNLL